MDIYAPNAEVDLDNGFPLVGSVIAECFAAKNGASLSCDPLNPPDASPFEPGTFFEINRWWEGAVGDTPPNFMP